MDTITNLRRPRPRTLWLGETPDGLGDEAARVAGLGVSVIRPGGAPATDDEESRAAQALADALDPARPQIDPATADALARLFDSAVIVDHPVWANEILRVFPGRVVLRGHGEGEVSFGEELFHLGAYPILVRRRDVRYLVSDPFVAAGDPILVSIAAHAPAWISDEVAAVRDRWVGPGRGATRVVLVGAPKPGDGDYARAYDLFVSATFAAPDFSPTVCVGLEPGEAGAARTARLARMRVAAGWMHPFVDERRQHVAPIEMMILGGPVVYLASPPMRALMPAGAPGEAETVDEALAKCALLRVGDAGFVAELRAAQAEARARWRREAALPEFDALFGRELLGAPGLDAPDVARTGTAAVRPAEADHVLALARCLQFDPAEGAAEAERVVGAFYRLALGREPDADGLRAHVATLIAGARPTDLWADFVNSPEGRAKRAEGFLGWLDAHE